MSKVVRRTRAAINSWQFNLLETRMTGWAQWLYLDCTRKNLILCAESNFQLLRFSSKDFVRFCFGALIWLPDFQSGRAILSLQRSVQNSDPVFISLCMHVFFACCEVLQRGQVGNYLQWIVWWTSCGLQEEFTQLLRSLKTAEHWCNIVLASGSKWAEAERKRTVQSGSLHTPSTTESERDHNHAVIKFKPVARIPPNNPSSFQWLIVLEKPCLL